MTVPLINPDKLEVPEAIKIAAIKGGGLTFFIGNGVSQLFGVPSWDELANKMLRSLASYGKINHSQLEILLKRPTKIKVSIADHYFKKNLESKEFADLKYESVLMKDIKREDIHKKIPAYKLIAECNVKLITTNYDWLLSDALTSIDTSSSIIEEAKAEQIDAAGSSTMESLKENKYTIYESLEKFEEASLKSNYFLVHLHGALPMEEALIASTESYLKLYGDPDNQRKLGLLFKNQTVVFIGYSLDELEILDLIIRSSKSYPKTEESPRFFIVLSLLSHEAEILEQLEEYYKKIGITLLAFCRDIKGYHALSDVLAKWSSEIKAIIQPPTAYDQHRLIDELGKAFNEVSR